MSEHPSNTHPVPAIIGVAVLCLLVALGIGAMNSGAYGWALVPAGILFAFCTFVILVYGPDTKDA